MRALAREVAFKKIFENLFNQDDISLDNFFVIEKLEMEEDKVLHKIFLTVIWKTKKKLKKQLMKT